MDPASTTTTAPWVVLMVLLPLAAALLLVAVPRSPVAIVLRALVPVGVAAVFVLLVKQLVAAGPARYAVGGWAAPLGVDLYVDGMALLLLGATTLVCCCVSVFGSAYFRSGPASVMSPAAGGLSDQQRRFWPLFWMLWAALNALFVSADVFNLYVTLEMVSLASVGLIVLSGTPQAIAAALRYLLLAVSGSMFYLLGVALLYAAYDTLDLALLAERVAAEPASWAAAVLITIGLMLKSALFPFHGWLPPAHAGAPVPASAVLSALVVKASFFLLLRMWLFVFVGVMSEPLVQALGALGVGAILWGSVQALLASSTKRLIAYSTVAQVGYLFLVFPLATNAETARLAIQGCLCLAVSHALAKAAVFLVAGCASYARGSGRIEALAGLGRLLPVAFTAFALAAVSLMGLPPGGGFAGKWLLLQASIETGQWWWALAVVAGGLLSAAYLFRIASRALAESAEGEPSRPTPLRMQWSAMVLAGGSIVVGLGGFWLLPTVDIGLGELLGSFGEVQR